MIDARALRGEISMTEQGIAEQVEDVVQRHLHVPLGRIHPWTYFVDDLGADSLALVDLTLALEEAFDIDIQTDDVERLSTVQEAIDYVARCLAAGRATAAPTRDPAAVRPS
jgi:acyl carrier protein